MHLFYVNYEHLFIDYSAFGNLVHQVTSRSAELILETDSTYFLLYMDFTALRLIRIELLNQLMHDTLYIPGIIYLTYENVSQLF